MPFCITITSNTQVIPLASEQDVRNNIDEVMRRCEDAIVAKDEAQKQKIDELIYDKQKWI